MKPRDFSREFRKALSLIRTHLTNSGLILLYHRVTVPDCAPDFDPFSMCISPQNFEEHLSILSRVAQPMRLEEMLQKSKSGSLPPRAVAITFDDGYADNLYQAKPLLEKFKIPATVFIITGHLGEAFWWDDLSHIILQAEILPQNLGLKLNGHIHQTFLTNNDKLSRRKLLKELLQFLQPLSSAQQRVALQQLSNWAGLIQENQCDHRPLTVDELKKLSAGELIEIGAHTVTHPSLADLPLIKQQEEIVNSKVLLEQALNRTIRSFSYPFGLKNDYTNDTISLVRGAGFEYACSNEIGTVWSKSDLFQLPRYWIKNWSGPVFAKQIQRWLPG